MWIVKLGGSLYQQAELNHWLKQLSHVSQQHPILIVPGGGPFANQVRQAQQHYAFDDPHAHHMALLAMAQFGITLLGLSTKAQPFYYPSASSDKQQKLSVWLPDKDLLKQTDIPQSWQVTSDSLALWLAHHLKATKLLIVKQALPHHQSTITELSQQGIIDQAFPDFFKQYHVSTTLALACDYDKVQQLFNKPSLTL